MLGAVSSARLVSLAISCSTIRPEVRFDVIVILHLESS